MRHGRISSLIAAVLFAISVVAIIGCDDRRSSSLIETKPATQPSKPTTQELMAGPQQKIALRSIPFTLSVPMDWKIKSEAGVLLLEGSTPSGIVQVQIGRHPSPIPEHAARLIEGAKRDASARPGQYVRADVREIGGIKVLETRSVGDTKNAPAIDAAGSVVAPTSTPMSWKLSAFVQNGRDQDVCEVHFIDLTVEQYERDQELLERIFASFEYDPKAESN